MRSRYTFFISACCYILLSSTILAQNTTSANTIKISGSTESIILPQKITLREAPELEAGKVEVALQKELDSYILDMQNQKVISDNVVSDVMVGIIDEGGIPALKVTYSYSLINDTMLFQTDDFSTGNYRIEGSNAAMVTLALMKRSLEEQLKKYLTTQKKVTITISGSADAVPIRKTISYKGEYGTIISENCDMNGTQKKVTVSTSNGISDNYTLAFLRSYSVRDYIMNYIPALKETSNTYFHKAMVSEYLGGKYRRVSIEILVHNAFENSNP